MKVFLILLLAGMHLIKGSEKLTVKLLETNETWDTSKISEAELVKMPQREACSKFVEDQTGNPNYFREEQSKNYMDALPTNLLQISERYLPPKDSLNLKKTNKKNMLLTITGQFHNVFENSGNIQVYRKVQKQHEIKWEDPDNLISQDRKLQIEKCLLCPESQRANCLFDEVSKWCVRENSNFYRFYMKILFTVLGKLNEGKTLVQNVLKWLGKDRKIECQYPNKRNRLVNILKTLGKNRKKKCQQLILRTAWNNVPRYSRKETIATEDLRKIAEILVKEGTFNETLMEAVRGYDDDFADIKLIEALATCVDLNNADDHGRTLVFIAVAADRARKTADLKVVKFLAEHGVDLNKADNSGQTPVYIAAATNYPEAVEVLAEHGANLNKADDCGRTPVYIATANGHDEAVKVLAENGADLNKADNCGRTPVNIAVNSILNGDGHEGIFKILVGSKAKLGESFLSIAKTKEKRKLLEKLIEEAHEQARAEEERRLFYKRLREIRLECMKEEKRRQEITQEIKILEERYMEKDLDLLLDAGIKSFKKCVTTETKPEYQ